MNKKSKVGALLSDDKCLWDLTLPPLQWLKYQTSRSTGRISVASLHKDRSVSVGAVEVIDSLGGNFEMRSRDFCSHATIYVRLKPQSPLKSRWSRKIASWIEWTVVWPSFA
jgi:hypothetical protein